MENSIGRGQTSFSYFEDVVEKAIQNTAKDIIEIIEEVKKVNQRTHRYIADEVFDLVIDVIKVRYGVKDE